MTLPHEEWRAIASVRRFLYDLLDPKKTPRVPKAIRQEARRVSKHYPLFPTQEQINLETFDISCTEMCCKLIDKKRKKSNG